MTTHTPTLPKKTRLRFKEEDDLILLHEVQAYNPFRTPDMWKLIKEHVFAATKKEFPLKTLKDHLDLLVKGWLDRKKSYKDRFGVDEAYTETDKVLEQIYGFMLEFRTPIKKKQNELLGILARNQGWISLDHEYTYFENATDPLATSDLTRKRSLMEETQDNSNSSHMRTHTPTLPRKTRLRFKEEDDFILLREVQAYNPFRTPDMWKLVKEHVFAATTKEFAIKTLKDHLDLLIKNWLEKTKKYKDRSGIAEEYTEKDKMLKKIYGFMLEFRSPIKNKQETGILARNQCSIILDHEYTNFENSTDPLATSDLTRKRSEMEETQDNSNFSQNTITSGEDVTPETSMEPQIGKFNVFNMRTQTPTLPRKTRLRFKDEDDLILLREVRTNNPFRTPDMWKLIKEHVFAATTKEFAIKTLKNHLDRLIKNWLEKTNKYKDRSGIEYTEKDKVCEEIHGLMLEFRNPVQRKELGIWAKILNEHCNSNSDIYTEEEVEDISENKNFYSSIIQDHEYTYLENATDQITTSDIMKQRLLMEETEDNSNFSQQTDTSDGDATPETPIAPQRGKDNAFGTIDAAKSLAMLDQFDPNSLFRRRLRFTIKDDLTLFQLVKSYDPFQYREKWVDIQKGMQKNTGKPFILRTIKDRVTHLIKRYVTEDMKYNKAHATPDQWKAKSKLLADIVNLRIQAVTRKCLNVNSKDELPDTFFKSNTPSPPPVSDYVLVKVESENEADEDDNQNDNEDTFNYMNGNNDADDSFDEEDEKPLRPPKHKKPKIEKEFNPLPVKSILSETAGTVPKTESLEALVYLTNRHQDELNLKNRLLAVNEKKVAIKENELALDREQFELQRMERTQRLEVELKERELHMKVLEQQQQMIAMLLEQTRQG